MSKEEREALEILNNIYFCDDMSFCRECIYKDEKKDKCVTEEYDCQERAIKIALSIIRKQQKELEKAEKEIIKQDKIIDLMSEYIDFDKLNFQCSSLCIERNCVKECIKQYFEKKVSENNE